MSRHASRAVILVTASCLVMFVWAFPVLWTLLTSLKPGVDVLAYPPVVIFEPRWRNYWDVLFGPTSILPHLWDSLAVSVLATTITIALAVPAAYGFARLRFWGRRALGFYTLATQMLPRIGLVIPYFLFLNRVGWIDTYRGLVLVYLTFSLPFVTQAIGTSKINEVMFASSRMLRRPSGGSRGFRLIRSKTSPRLTTKDSVRCPTNTLPGNPQPGMVMVWMKLFA